MGPAGRSALALVGALALACGDVQTFTTAPEAAPEGPPVADRPEPPAASAPTPRASLEPSRAPTPGVDGARWAPAPERIDPRLGPCRAPEARPPDPLLTREVHPLIQATGFPVHMLDVAPDPDRDVVYLLGMGGLFVLLPDGDGGHLTASNTLDLWLGEGETVVRTAQFSELEPLGGGYLAMSNRDFGLSIVDASAPSAPVVVRSIALPNAAGLSHHGALLVVVTHGGELVTFDVRDPADPRLLGRVGGLGNPWDVTVRGVHAYVADNTLGLGIVDLSNPRAPRLLGAVPTAGGAQDVELAEDMLYVAVGSAGVEIFDPKTPEAPERLRRFDAGAPVVSVSVDEGRLWGATLDHVFVADVRDPRNPRPLARERTEEHAMAVHAVGATALVADWSRFVRLELQPERAAPSLDPERTEIVVLFDPEPSRAPRTLTLPIVNRGGGTLHIVGAEVDDPRFSFALDRNLVAPGGRATLTLEMQDDGGEVDGALCLASNDPERPILRVPLRSSPTGRTTVGEFAPDFVLPTIQSDEVTYRLSDQLGHPVVLVYFALW